MQEVENLKRTENLVLIRNDLRRNIHSSNWKKRTGADFSRVVRPTPERHTRKVPVTGKNGVLGSCIEPIDFSDAFAQRSWKFAPVTQRASARSSGWGFTRMTGMAEDQESLVFTDGRAARAADKCEARLTVGY